MPLLGCSVGPAVRTTVGSTALLQQPLGLVERVKSPPRCAHSGIDEIERNDNPEGVHEHKVTPEVKRLRARVRTVEEVVVEQARGIVEHVAVELSERDDDLEWIAERVVGRDEAGGHE